MRLLSQMHSSFHGVSGLLSVRSSSPCFSDSSPSLSLLSASLSFYRTLGLLLYTTRTNIANGAHSRSHPSPPSFSFLPQLPFAPATRQCFLFVFGIHVLLSASSSFFLHHHIVVRPFSGSGINSRVSGPPCDVGSPWFFITLVTGVVTLLGTPSFRTWYMKAARR